MDRRAFLAALGVGASTGGLVSGSAHEPERYHNPVFERVFADPDVIGTVDAYYAYGTYNDWGQPWSRRLVPVLRSPNLVDWEWAGEAFAEKPDWRDRPGLGLWAPGIARLDGRFVLYYSLATFGDPNPGIGVATSQDPVGLFEDRGKLLQSDEIGVENSIDPCLFEDDGDPYLFWGSHRGIYGVPLADDGLRTDGEKFQIAGTGVEAPYVVDREGWYYFFGSRGTCCAGAASTYRVVVGRAEALDGPYVNRASEPLLDAPGTPILRGNERFAGPGHCSVVRDDAGTYWLLYHAYERADAWVGPVPRRVLMLSPLAWEDGWPVVAGGTPAETGPMPETDG